MDEKHIRELLPIGSVILLRGAQKALMVLGVCQTAKETDTLYDYIGVLWPEGNIGPESQYLFNHTDIEKVFFRGLDGIQRDEFIDLLVDHYKEMEARK